MPSDSTAYFKNIFITKRRKTTYNQSSNYNPNKSYPKKIPSLCVKDLSINDASVNRSFSIEYINISFFLHQD